MKNQSIKHVIFDLSEVLIRGLYGMDLVLARELSVPEEAVSPCLLAADLEELFTGRISESTYLERVIRYGGWGIGVPRLGALIRMNFHREVSGSQVILNRLVGSYDLVLLSDHAREWVAYIKTVHPFLSVFERMFFSYDLQSLKDNPRTFLAVLDAMSYHPGECLVIDDSPANIQVAASVGIKGIRFVHAGQLAVDLEGIGVVI